MTRLLVLGGVLTAAFLALGLVTSGSPRMVDDSFRDELRGEWRGPLGDVAGVVSDVLGPVLPVLLGTVLLVVAGVLWQRGERDRPRLLLKVTLVLALCRATSWVFKPLFDRARPRDYPDFSYPSGHVVSVASTGFAVLVLCVWLAPRLARLVVAGSLVASALSAASRMVLAVHWLTDTVGSVLAVTGVGLLAAAALGLLPARRRDAVRSGDAATAGE